MEIKMKTKYKLITLFSFVTCIASLYFMAWMNAYAQPSWHHDIDGFLIMLLVALSATSTLLTPLFTSHLK